MEEVEKFHDSIIRGDSGVVSSLLSNNRALVNAVNQEGLFPLHQACFRGHLNLVDFLLKNGASVNAADKKQGYTALMFAAITGNLELLELLLNHGASPDETNRVNRTAAQMASFVGNPHASTFINNFFERAELEQFTKPNVPEDLRLNTNSVGFLYRVLLDLNVTPVKILLRLNSCGTDVSDTAPQKASTVLVQWRQAAKVLEALSGKYFTPHKTHEPLALKFHIVACLLRRAGEHMDAKSTKPTNDDRNSKDQGLSDLIRQFLNGTKPHGLPIGQEKFIRQALLSFPHTESTLWRQLVLQVSKTQPGQSPTALSLLECAINGRGPFAVGHGDSASEFCATCGDRGKGVQIMLCRNCHETGYCSVACQRQHWFTHKKFCPILKEQHDAC